MANDASGTLWAVMTVAGPLLLLAALIYGTMAYRRRSGRLREVGEQKTKDLYKKEDS